MSPTWEKIRQIRTIVRSGIPIELLYVYISISPRHVADRCSISTLINFVILSLLCPLVVQCWVAPHCLRLPGLSTTNCVKQDLTLSRFLHSPTGQLTSMFGSQTSRRELTTSRHGIAMEPESRPLLYYHNGRIILNYNRQALMSVDGSSRSAHLRNLSALQVEALDAIEGIARKCRLSFNMDSGDMLFINNNAMLHARQGFTDSVWSTRHLHRLWLRDPLMAWKLPLDMEKGNQMIYGLSRWEEKWDLVPPRKTTFTLSERLGQ